MLYHNIRVGAYVGSVIDATVVVVASGFAWEAASGRGFGLPLADSGWWWFAAPFVLAHVLIYARLKVYQPWRTEGIGRELLAVGECSLYSIGLASAVAAVFGGPLHGWALGHAIAAGLVALMGMRVALRLALQQRRRAGDDYRTWLIVGRNARAAALVAELQARPHYGIRVAGVVDVGPGEAGVSGAEDLAPLAGLPARHVDDIGQLRQTLVEGAIDEVVILLPMRSCYDRIHRLLALCEEAGISVKLHPDQFELPCYQRTVTHVGRMPMLTHYRGPSNHAQLAAKRAMDVVLAAAALVALGPLLLLLALAVKLSSPGPAFFRQQRVGLHGRSFSMVKFRSMYTGRPQQPQAAAAQGLVNQRDGLAFKMKDDPRITPVGRWMRKFHVDELPQLWNVLVGDMSLVGPRPLPLHEATGHEWWQRRRLSVPPGLTCFWQLHDDPTIPFQEWMHMDMRYIDSWTFWLDVKIIARTFGTLARGRGW